MSQRRLEQIGAAGGICAPHDHRYPGNEVSGKSVFDKSNITPRAAPLVNATLPASLMVVLRASRDQPKGPLFCGASVSAEALGPLNSKMNW